MYILQLIMSKVSIWMFLQLIMLKNKEANKIMSIFVKSYNKDYIDEVKEDVEKWESGESNFNFPFNQPLSMR